MAPWLCLGWETEQLVTTSLPTVLPREQAGIRTGRKYEFQYEEAALACLQLLEEGPATCVYCEWHDDYVVEHHDRARSSYKFHQVKTRSDLKGGWSMFEILGVRKPKDPPPPKKKAPSSKKPTKPQAAKPQAPKPAKLTLRAGTSIAIRMLDHHRKFKDACSLFMLVSPSDVTKDPMYTLVQTAKSCAAPTALPADLLALFQGLLVAHQKRDSSITEEELWALVVRLDIVLARCSEDDPKVAVGLMGQLIYELSEVNVTVTEQARIASALVTVVRDRAHTKLDVLPSELEVREKKSVSLPKVLELIPLSVEGYERLRRGETKTVKSLSRLQRLCRASQIKDEMMVVLCDLKLDWHAWRARVGDSLTKDILGVLLERGRSLLDELTRGTSATRFQDLQRSSDAAATELSLLPRMPGGLTGATIMGLVFALAAESV